MRAGWIHGMEKKRKPLARDDRADERKDDAPVGPVATAKTPEALKAVRSCDDDVGRAAVLAGQAPCRPRARRHQVIAGGNRAGFLLAKRLPAVYFLLPTLHLAHDKHTRRAPFPPWQVPTQLAHGELIPND